MNTAPRLPSLFLSHGAPDYALAPGTAGAGLSALGQQLPRPRAIVALSPHWMSRGVVVGGATRPTTIHDFAGFDPQLYQLQYSAPGDPPLAEEIAALLQAQRVPVQVDPARGLDHGVWVPLRWLYAEADIPVVPLSMPVGLDPAGAYQLGRLLQPLAADGVLLIGSGSLTHNLGEFRQPRADMDYVREFADWMAAAVLADAREQLLDCLQQAPQAHRAHPTIEHLLPLYFALGAAPEGHSRNSVLRGDITHRILAMDSYVFGSTEATLN